MADMKEFSGAGYRDEGSSSGAVIEEEAAAAPPLAVVGVAVTPEIRFSGSIPPPPEEFSPPM